MARRALAAGLTLGVLLDEFLGDPRRGHPVAAFGMVAAALERASYADSRRRGTVFTAVTLLPLLAVAHAIERRLALRPIARAAAVALTTWAVLGGRSLRAISSALGEDMAAGDLTAMRESLPSLCGRDPDSLDAAGIARATVESVAENTCDAVVAPLFWGAIGGLPGLVCYRAVNTLDAMVGHRSARHARFGTASARLDDLANYAPARLTGALAVLAARCVHGDGAAGWRAWRRDASAHPSPNAGVCEAAFAGVLGLQLGGPTNYGDRIEQRPLLGVGRAPQGADIPRAARLSRAVESGALALAVVWIGARR